MEAGHPASNSKEYGSREEVKKYNNMAAGHHGGGGGIKKHDIASFRVDDDLRSDLVQLQFSFGMESTRRYNMQYIDTSTIVVAAGNTVKILNIQTHQHTLLPGVSGTAIGAMAVHPSLRYLAVAEKGMNPCIFIYTYPQLCLYRVLQGGTLKSYTYVSFSHTGSKLASVGGAPDYILLSPYRGSTLKLSS